MSGVLKTHFGRGMPDRALCGADIRRGGFTSDDARVTCLRCRRKRSKARATGSRVVSRTWRNATTEDLRLSAEESAHLADVLANESCDCEKCRDLLLRLSPISPNTTCR